MDVDGEMPEVRALAAYYAGRGGALWAAERDGAIAGMRKDGTYDKIAKKYFDFDVYGK